MTLLIHQIFTGIFGFFILIDRFFLRAFLEKEKREKIYNVSKKFFIFISSLIFISGGLLFLEYQIEVLILAKGFLGVLLIFMFFYCPYFMKKAKCEDCKKIYRSLVTLILMLVVFLGIAI